MQKLDKKQLPRLEDIQDAINGNEEGFMHIADHYRNLGYYMVSKKVKKFAYEEGISTGIYPREDMEQEMYLNFFAGLRHFSR